MVMPKGLTTAILRWNIYILEDIQLIIRDIMGLIKKCYLQFENGSYHTKAGNSLKIGLTPSSNCNLQGICFVWVYNNIARLKISNQV